jgi:hypothetical protein
MTRLARRSGKLEAVFKDLGSIDLQVLPLAQPYNRQRCFGDVALKVTPLGSIMLRIRQRLLCLTRHRASRRRASSEARPERAVTEITVRHGTYVRIRRGSDIGPKGEWRSKHHHCGIGALGSSLNVDTASSIKYSVTNDLRFSVGPLAEYHSFRHALLVNRSGMNFSGMFVEARWKIVDRLIAPFGMSLNVAPEWRRIDSATGHTAESYGVFAALLIDKEIVPDRFFTVLNLIYAPSLLRLSSSGWVHDDAFIAIAGGSYAISPRLLFGAEVRHENLAHNGFLTAHALFVGPHLYMSPAENLSVKIAWAVQIPDVAAHRADLVNFERSQVLLQLVTHF